MSAASDDTKRSLRCDVAALPIAMDEPPRTRSPLASPSPSTSWISLSDLDSVPPALSASMCKLTTSASALDMAAYAPQHFAPASPSVSHDALLDERTRRYSMASSTGGVTLEDDIRSIGEQMKRVLAFCDLQSQNPIRLQAKINDLQEQLQLAIKEKNYWMKRCKEMASSRSTKNEFAIRECDEDDDDDAVDARTSCCLLACYESPVATGLTYSLSLSICRFQCLDSAHEEEDAAPDQLGAHSHCRHVGLARRRHRERRDDRQ